MGGNLFGVRAKTIARIAPAYCFMFFFGPVAWQLWMAMRLSLVSLEESRRCLLSPLTICIAVFLFALNAASLARGVKKIAAGQEGEVPRRMAVHCASLLGFATVGTVAAMSALPGADGGGLSRPLKMIIGSLNGASMCFVFYASSTASVIARLMPPEGRPRGNYRSILERTRTFNARLFALGLPLFPAASLAAASLGGCNSTAGSTLRLLASMVVPVTMGCILFFRADRRIASLRGVVGKEIAR